MKAWRWIAALLAGAATSALALEPGAVYFSNTYALSVFDGLSGVLVGSNGFRVGGAGQDDAFGTAAAAAGDVNGDGRADVIVGAPTYDQGPTFRVGRGYLLYGSAIAVPDQAVTLLTNVCTIDGVVADDQAGTSVAGGGDFNGDGFDDVAVGIPTVTNAGRVALVFGAASLPATLSAGALNGTNGCVLSGEAASNRAGFAVAFAGDVNGDGRDDLLVGAPDYATGTNAKLGCAYLVLGSTGTTASLPLGALDGTNGCRLTGFGSGYRAGACVAGLGDFDGDGLGDVFIGSPSAGSFFEGQGHVVFGRTNWPSVLSLADLTGTNGFRVYGPTSFFAAFGTAAAGADVNGDGLRDLLVGSQFNNPVYVLLGTTNRAAARDVSAADGTNGFAVAGPAASFFGTSLARAGRVNFDAYDDVLIGARDATVGGFASAGEVYVLFGHPALAATTQVSALQGTNGFSLAGQQSGARAGSAVASAGDWDDDGLDDLLIGEYQADYGTPAATNAGAIYIISPLGLAQQVLYRPEWIGAAREGATNRLTWQGQPGVTYGVYTSAAPDQPWGLAATVGSGGYTSTWDHAGASTTAIYRLDVRR